MLKQISSGVVAFLSILTSSVAHASVLLPGAVWNVAGTDTGGISWDESTLVFTSQTATSRDNFNIDGYFDWVGSGGQSGRELFSGMYFGDGRLEFSGTQLVNPRGIVTADYEGRVSFDGSTIVGDWDGIGIPGDFTASRAPTATILLDFESDVGVGVVEKLSQGLPILVTDPFGDHPSANISDRRSQQIIVDKVTEIFSDAGLYVSVLSSGEDGADEIFADAVNPYRVEFGVAAPREVLHGVAYDTTNFRNAHIGVDRLDRRNDGTVAVFADVEGLESRFSELNPYELIGEAVAHELGHGFGLYHIDAGEGLGEVLDYDVEDTARAGFYDSPTNLGLNSAGLLTHNPRYHLLSHVGGYSAEQLSDIGLTAGTYDEGSYTVATFRALFSAIGNLGDDLYLGTGLIEPFGASLSPVATFSDDFSLTAVGGWTLAGELEFSMDTDLAASFLASSTGGRVLDIRLGDRRSFSPNQAFSFMDLANRDLGLFRFDETTSAWSFFSDVEFDLLSLENLGTQVSPVPLPGGLLFIFSFLLSLGLVRLAKSNQKHFNF